MWQSSVNSSVARSDEGLRSYMLKIYNYMGAGVGVTGLVAWLVSSNPVLTAFFLTGIMKWIVILAPLAFILVMSFKLETMATSTLQMLFWAFCGVMGLSMATVFLVFTGASIAKVFFITAGMFFGTSLYGYTTKKDLTSMGSFMMMGLIGLLIAMIVNIFLASSVLAFVISILGVIIFLGLTAYDTQNIKEMYYQNADEKMAIMGALSLYLNFVNLFQFLLQLLGNRE